ncbi:unnamed protein product, partial [Prorocentrum cordatum]
MSARQTEVLGSPVGRTASMTPSALQGVSPFFPEGAGGVERRPSGPLQPGQAQPQIVMCHFGDPGQPFQLHRLDDATPASAIRPGLVGIVAVAVVAVAVVVVVVVIVIVVVVVL